MCRELEALRQSMLDYSQGFDAHSLTPAQARTVVGLCTQIVSAAGSVKVMAAAVAAQDDSYKAQGYRSAEEQLARQTGMSSTQARRALATGRRLLKQPEVAKAALSGELSGEQAQAVSAGAEANPAKTAELLNTAKDSSMAELNEAVAKARSDGADLEKRRRAIHAARRLARFTDTEGVYHAYLSGNPEDGITIDVVLTEIRRKLTTSRRERQVPNERFETLDYDAMVALFDLACGKDSEISLYDLIDIGLFPQFDSTAVTPRSPTPTAAPAAGDPVAPAPAPTTPHPTDSQPAAAPPPAGQPEAAPPAAGEPEVAPDQSQPSDGCDPLSLFDDDGPDTAAGRDGAPPGTGGNSPPPTSPAASSLPVPLAASPPAPTGKQKASRLAGRPAKIIVRVDLDVLLRGYPLEGETCDSPGYGPVPVSLIHDLMASGQARLAAVITKGQEIRAVHLLRRHPNEYQKAALDYLYPVCAVKGCNTRAGLEADHREDWTRTHYTVVDLLDHLCWHHHQLKSHKGWALVDGHGKRDFVPPHDPRHPRNSQEPGQVVVARSVDCRPHP